MYYNLTDFITRQARLISEQMAVSNQKEQFTYLSLNNRVNQTKYWLQERGIQKGDRVAMLCEHSAQALVIFIAIARLGAIALPLRTFLKKDELSYMLRDGGPKMLIHDPQLTDQIKALSNLYDSEFFVSLDSQFQSMLSNLPADDSADISTKAIDPLMIIYTSGTTGKPKGAIITHQNISSVLDIWKTLVQFPEQQARLLTLNPLSHLTGVMLCFSSLYTGSLNIIRSQASPAQIWEVVEQESILSFIAAPSGLRQLLREPTLESRNISSLRSITIGGTSIPTDLFALCQQRGLVLKHGFGSTETGQISIWQPEMGLNKRQTDGRIFANAHVKIIDPDTNETLPIDKIGEVTVKSPSVFAGYWNNPKQTEDSFHQGWYRTGDLGKRDAEGFLTIVGRRKDMIIRNAYNIYPAEVESVVQELSDVQDVAVVGRKDSLEGEVPCIVVVKKAGSDLTAEQILSYARSKLADQKCGDEVRFVMEFPYNETGKVMKHKLKEQLQID